MDTVLTTGTKKTSLYEEVINIPFIISQKGKTQAGAVNDTHLVSLGLDLFPTLCDIGGATLPNDLEGLSLRPLAEGQTPNTWRDHLIVETEINIGSGPGGGGASRAVLTNQYKYSLFPMGRYREQLVDLQNDRGEMINLAVNSHFNDIRQQHRDLLRTWCKKTSDPFLKMCE